MYLKINAAIILIMFQASILNLSAKILTINKLSDTVAEYSRITIDITTDIHFGDPYNSDSITMDAIFKTGTDSVILSCFYLSGNSDTSYWQARFAPMKTGQCNYYLKIKTADTSIVSSSDTFTVVDSSKDGFLSADPSSYYQFKYSSGKPFRGVGMDLSWEGDIKYDTLFDEFYKRQANFTRLWMCPWNLGIQWNNGKYAYNQAAVGRMDTVVSLAEKYGIYYILSLDYHGALITQPDPTWGGGNNWPDNPANVVNGGTCVTPKEFFYNAQAKKRYKDRLRYLVGRWGYSPSICIWEFWNEIDNAIGSENIPVDSVFNWHKEMAKYLKALNPYHHFISTSFGGYTGYEKFFGIPEIGISQIHQYYDLTTMSANITILNGLYGKPTIIAEFAYDWHTPISSNINDYLQAWHDGLWRGLFSPTPVTPLSWWWDNYYYNGISNYDNLKYVAEFSGKIAESGTIKKIFSPTGGSGLEQKGLLAGNDMFLWLRNNQSKTINNITLTISSVSSGSKNIMVFNPESGDTVISSKTVSGGKLAIAINSIQSAGDIALRVSNVNSSSVSTSINTSVNSTQVNNEFVVFPNPVLNTLTIQGNDNPGSKSMVIISNGYGDIVKNLIWDNSSGSLEIDMGQYPAGLYIIKISNAEKNCIFKIIHVK